MFKIVTNPEFTHDVTVMTPVDGGFKEETFKCRFKLLDADRIDKFSITSSFSALNATFLKEVIVRFEDLIGDDDKPLPYNDALRDLVLATPGAQMALMQTYLTAISKVKQGN